MDAHAVSHYGVGLRKRKSHWICHPKPWTRRGTDSFLGQEILPGAGENSLSGSTPKALSLMGDWCGLLSDTE